MMCTLAFSYKLVSEQKEKSEKRQCLILTVKSINILLTISRFSFSWTSLGADTILGSQEVNLIPADFSNASRSSMHQSSQDASRKESTLSRGIRGSKAHE